MDVRRRLYSILGGMGKWKLLDSQSGSTSYNKTLTFPSDTSELAIMFYKSTSSQELSIGGEEIFKGSYSVGLGDWIVSFTENSKAIVWGYSKNSALGSSSSSGAAVTDIWDVGSDNTLRINAGVRTADTLYVYYR